MDGIKSFKCEVSSDDREFKAHIYQQLISLQPYLSSETELSVGILRVNQNGDECAAEAVIDAMANADYLLTLTVSLGGAHVVSQGQASDPFLAFDRARDGLLAHLIDWNESARDPRERERQIRVFADAAGSGARMVH